MQWLTALHSLCCASRQNKGSDTGPDHPTWTGPKDHRKCLPRIKSTIDPTLKIHTHIRLIAQIAFTERIHDEPNETQFTRVLAPGRGAVERGGRHVCIVRSLLAEL